MLIGSNRRLVEWEEAWRDPMDAFSKTIDDISSLQEVTDYHRQTTPAHYVQRHHRPKEHVYGYGFIRRSHNAKPGNTLYNVVSYEYTLSGGIIWTHNISKWPWLIKAKSLSSQCCKHVDRAWLIGNGSYAVGGVKILSVINMVCCLRLHRIMGAGARIGFQGDLYVVFSGISLGLNLPWPDQGSCLIPLASAVSNIWLYFNLRLPVNTARHPCLQHLFFTHGCLVVPDPHCS
eukprot:Gb_17933 [translate_table: standard]